MQEERGMKIIVIVEQIPDPTQVYVSRSRAEAVTAKAERIIAPNDKNALEEALELKDEHEVSVVALAIGPPDVKVANTRRTTVRAVGSPEPPASVCEDALREAMAMGADGAILLSDDAFVGLDAAGTVAILGQAIERVGDYYLVLTGSSSQIGPRLAERLGLPQITNIRSLAFGEGVIRAQGVLAEGYVEMETDLPALVTVASEANVPRLPPAPDIMDAYREREVTVWDAANLGFDPEELAPLTQAQRAFVPPEREREILTGDPEEVAQDLARRLKERGLL
jgi:electron transfer flavoprotein alpha/beta subunit